MSNDSSPGPLPTKPRILVFGAGVLGTLYAAKIALAGHDVTVAERAPERIQQIETDGLIIEPISGGKRETVRVPVVTGVDATAEFDIAIVIARKTHLNAIVETLAPTRIPTLLFMGGNAEGPQALIDAVGQRALVGFPGAGGGRDGSVVKYSIPPKFMQQTMLGETDDSHSERLQSVRELFASAGFSTSVPKSMDAWLKSHEGFVASIGNATYAAGNDGAALAADGELIRLNIRAIREVYAALDAAGVAVTPGWFRLWQRLPIGLIAASYSRFVGSPAWQLGTDQLISMRDEVELITQELMAFAKQSGVPTPALQELVARRDRPEAASLR
jgi:2-dehydropantoate 2-reductase